MTDDPGLVRRDDLVLRPDPRRVVTRLFVPGQEFSTTGRLRADVILQRVLNLSDAQVQEALRATIDLFGKRHQDVEALFEANFERVAHRITVPDLPLPRRRLIGAYCTQELSVEAAALFNPSMVAHPVQAGAGPGELRFVMSVRAVGEGHVSSVEFRSGLLTADGAIVLDATGPYVWPARTSRAPLSRSLLTGLIGELIGPADTDRITAALPETVDPVELDAVLDALAAEPGDAADQLADQVRWLASCNYNATFPDSSSVAERVLVPAGPDETHGLEDVRFTRFTDDDGTVSYLGTYTAYNGSGITSHLLQTDDFLRFRSTRMYGTGAASKGMALFPRRIDGRYAGVTRWDRESIGVAFSPDPYHWTETTTIKVPQQPWELIQLGNCGPPIETDHGWLVLTHGVGPVRTYGIGAMLLDLADPRQVVASLAEPILTPDEDEREGYVPNVVYSCGALVHDGNLVLPYGCSDSSIRFAVIGLDELLRRLDLAARPN